MFYDNGYFYERYYWVTFRYNWVDTAKIMSFFDAARLYDYSLGHDDTDNIHVFELTDHSHEYDIVDTGDYSRYDGTYVLKDRETGEIVDDAHWTCEP